VAAAKKAGFKLGKAQKGLLVCGRTGWAQWPKRRPHWPPQGSTSFSIHALAATGCCFNALIVVAAADFPQGRQGAREVDPDSHHSPRTIGMRHPVPKAREVTFNPGAACLRLNSAFLTSHRTRRTVAGS